MKFFNQHPKELHPESMADLQFWSKKWGITVRQLNEAIVDTGSTNISFLKSHLKKNHISQIPFLGWIRTCTNKFSYKTSGY